MRSGHQEYARNSAFQVEPYAAKDNLCQEYRKSEEDEEEIDTILSARGPKHRSIGGALAKHCGLNPSVDIQESLRIHTLHKSAERAPSILGS